MYKRHITESRVAAMGKSVSEIASESGLTRQTIHQRLNTLPSDIREVYVTKNKNRFVIDDDLIKYLIRSEPMPSVEEMRKITKERELKRKQEKVAELIKETKTAQKQVDELKQEQTDEQQSSVQVGEEKHSTGKESSEQGVSSSNDDSNESSTESTSANQEEFLKKQIDFYRDQLVAKDHQLELKDKQLGNRSDEIKELHTLLSNSQSLQLVMTQRNKDLIQQVEELRGYLENKTTQEVDAEHADSDSNASEESSAEDTTVKHEKKGFFQRLFGK